MTKPIDPIFAPIPYGDDRQITRTRRGVYCSDEMKYNEDYVYCTCHSCGYQWIIEKIIYDYGLIGQGGTGNYTDLSSFDYGQYTERLGDCCTGGIGLCGGNNYAKVGEIYPYVYTTDPDTGEEIRSLGPVEDVYIRCIGGSGSNSPPVTPNDYGSQPLSCPHCCRVNFEAKWRLPADNRILASGGLCTSVIVIDFQRIKSDFSVQL